MASTSGYLTEKVSSTVSSPAVHYSAAYAAVRTENADSRVSVKLTFGAWLNGVGSRLGSGIVLTAFARVNGGAWQSVVLKNSAEAWSGTAKHEAGLTLSANTVGSAVNVEFYVSRVGSSYGGTAGVLGSADSPMSYSAALPAYTAAQTSDSTPTVSVDSAAGDKYIYIRVGGAWKKAVPYVNVGGVWKKAAPYVRVNGIWKST